MIEPMDLQASLDSMGILQPAFERWCSNPLPAAYFIRDPFLQYWSTYYFAKKGGTHNGF